MTHLNRRAVPVTSGSPDYASGETVGTLMSFPMRTPGGGGVIRRAAVKSADAIGSASVLYLFDGNPSLSTFTDNAAMAIHADDKAKLLATVDIASADFIQRSPGGLYIADKALAIPFQFPDADGRTIYAALAAGGAINLSGAAVLEVLLGAEVD